MLVCAVALIASTTTVAVAYQRPGRTRLASLASDGSQANHRSGSPEVSAGGRFVAFESFASNLGGGGGWDVFVRTMATGVTEQISVATSGVAGDKDSSQFDMSADGRFVAFRSPSTNLVDNDTNDTSDIFVRDRESGTTVIASLTTEGTEADGPSLHPSISGDGRFIAFWSRATNIVPDDTNGSTDLFVYDLTRETVERVSVATDGTEAVGESFGASGSALSVDGRFVAFESYATNLVDDDSNEEPDIFVHDRETGTTERVSVTDDRSQADGWSRHPAISADGRYVAFVSAAPNLVPGDNNGVADTFVHDRETGRTERVSVASDGVQSNAQSSDPSISADGRHVTFASGADNLIADDGNDVLDVFVHDRYTRSTDRASIAGDGSEGNSDSFDPASSPDGRFVAFVSRATFTPGDVNGHFDVFLRDRGLPNGAGTVDLIPQGDVIAANGWATFSGRVTQAADDPDDGAAGARAAGAELTAASLTHRPESEDVLVRLSVDSLPAFSGDAGAPGILYGLRFALEDTSYEVRAARSGTGPAVFALYRCEDPCERIADLTGGIGTTRSEVLVSVPLSALEATEGSVADATAFTALGDTGSGAVTQLDHVDLPDVAISVPHVSLGIAAAGVPENDVSFATAAELSHGTFGGALDVASLPSGEYEVWAKGCHSDLCGASSAAVTIDNGAVKGRTSLSFSEGSAREGQHSDDVKIEALLEDVTGSPVPDSEVSFELVGEGSSRTFGSTTDESGEATVSVALSEKPGPYRLIATYEGNDALDGSVTEANFQVGREDTDLELSLDDGNDHTLTVRLSDLDSPARGIPQRTVELFADSELFASGETDLQGIVSVEVPPKETGKPIYGATFAGDDYYRASAGTVYPPAARTDRISVGAAGEADEDSNTPSTGRGIALDGRYAAFHSLASNLVAGDTNRAWDVFLRDRETQRTTRLSIAGSTEADDDSFGPAITPDGDYVAFWSTATNLVPDDTNGSHDVFVRDISSGSITRVSVSTDSVEGNGDSTSPVISADGRFIAFRSDASNLVADDENESSDIFVHDRESGSTQRVSVASDGTEGNSGSFWTSISADGRYVSFRSAASNLVDGDTNESWDVFVHDREAGTTERISVADDESQGVGGSDENSISADGRYVVFRSHASNFVPEDTPASYDIFVRDRHEGTTERVSIGTNGEAPNGNSIYLSISADGRYVTFSSFASNLVPGDTNATSQLFSGADAFVHDRETRTTERVSVASDGSEGDDGSFLPSISPDGRYVEFSSTATDLVPRDTNEGMGRGEDVFVRDRGPETGVGHVEATVEGGDLSISGWAHFSGDVTSTEDPAGDAPPGARAIGAELTGAKLVDRPASDDLLMWLSLHSLPSIGGTGGSPGILYGVELSIDGIPYEVRATRGADRRSLFALYRCASSCVKVTDLKGGIGTSGPEVLVSVPREALDLPGTVSGSSAFTAFGDLDRGASTVLDEVAVGDIEVEAPRLSLGIARAGTPYEEVSFESQASLSGDLFEGEIDVSSLPAGSYEAWARGCHAGTCGAMSTPVTVPAAATTLSFTEGSATSGQYSDAVSLEARLAGSKGLPIAGAEVTFELAGSDSSRSFTATTDDDGIASVTPVLTELPGSHQLTVRFAGSDEYEPSSDTTVFVVDKEDSALDLTVSGKGSNRTLTARLADEDTPSDGIAGRSIDFYGEGEHLGSATTDADGVATLTAPPRYRGGRHDFEARFAGDDYYVASSDQEQS